MQKRHFVCDFCGKVVEYIAGERPCDVLEGWFIVSQWRGLGLVDRYSFCSLSCIKSWVDARVPEIPEPFRKAFEEEENT
jgi:hypothetical protein